MPTIRVEFFEGRTEEQKRAYAKALTDTTVQVLGGSPRGRRYPLLRHQENRLGNRWRAVER